MKRKDIAILILSLSNLIFLIGMLGWMSIAIDQAEIIRGYNVFVSK